MLRFDRAWWPKSDVFYHTSSVFPIFVNYYEHTGHPILVGLWSSTHAWESEALSDKEITEQCLNSLKKCLAIARTDGSNMPKPIEVEITRWGSDLCCLGSYTHIPVGVSFLCVSFASYVLYRKKQDSERASVRLAMNYVGLCHFCFKLY